MTHIEWIVHSDDLADAMEEIRATLPRDLRDRVHIRVESVAD